MFYVLSILVMIIGLYDRFKAKANQLENEMAALTRRRLDRIEEILASGGWLG